MKPWVNRITRHALKASPARYADAIRTKRNTSMLPTPSLRVPGFEDEDDDEDEYEAPHEWRPKEDQAVRHVHNLTPMLGRPI
jgi:hypothetical protein